MDKDILRRAIAKWGEKTQVRMIQEECLELSLAIQKLFRDWNTETFEAVIDEIADVEIVLAQAEMLFPEDRIQERVDFKMKRLEKRLKEKITKYNL